MSDAATYACFSSNRGRSLPAAEHLIRRPHGMAQSRFCRLVHEALSGVLSALHPSTAGEHSVSHRTGPVVASAAHRVGAGATWTRSARASGAPAYVTADGSRASSWWPAQPSRRSSSRHTSCCPGGVATSTSLAGVAESAVTASSLGCSGCCASLAGSIACQSMTRPIRSCFAFVPSPVQWAFLPCLDDAEARRRGRTSMPRKDARRQKLTTRSDRPRPVCPPVAWLRGDRR
jgi:hypothetical protein